MVPIFLFWEFAFKVCNADKGCAYIWLMISFLQFLPRVFKVEYPIKPENYFLHIPSGYVCVS